ncbi:6-phosphofructokinase 1 [Sporomusaceae bacterium BoRhaA]|uniref:6-phosphofructokinase n=1 Tax=Pelorhabdus rhamnosifermentans TaxID=2772457 RepID=UPI001C0629A7|nr:6-phosphofructokinase [Pelorhabdus rhamnosifermentans]MBU2699819.1 6-phosphofructokinase 1 [Pelorhabdus rhamnosifermentans]
MNKINGNCLIAQSGGPTSVINASTYGIIKKFLSLESEFTVYAGVHGIQGVLDKKLIDVRNLAEATLASLKNMPAAAFGSCRYKMKDIQEDEADYKNLIDIFKEFNIRYFLYIGGNDSMDAADKISRYAEICGYDVKVLGVPKTIDNDLVETDHCPGFGSTAKYVSNVGIELWADINAYKKESIMVMEVMGRDAGWIAASTGIIKRAIPGLNQLIYLPEVPFCADKFLADIKQAIQNNNKLLVVTSEGLKSDDGQYINIESNCYNSDAFGHAQLGGIGRYLQQCIKKNVTKNVKLTEVGVIQRCAMHCVSKTDLEEAEMVGRAALHYALEGYTGYMIALVRAKDKSYHCTTKLAKLDSVCNKVKNVPLNWLGQQNSVTQEMVDYIQPLIVGEVGRFSESGLIQYPNLSFFR